MSIVFSGLVFMLFQGPASTKSCMDKAKVKAAASEAVKKPNNSDGKNLSSALSTDEISAGLKDALSVGVDDVVAQPGQLETTKKWMDKAGMSGSFDDLDKRLNDAAEVATPEAKQLLLNAIAENSAQGTMSTGMLQVYLGFQAVGRNWYASGIDLA